MKHAKCKIFAQAQRLYLYKGIASINEDNRNLEPVVERPAQVFTPYSWVIWVMLI